MLLLCVAFALITVGLVLPCILDIAMTPDYLFDAPSKRMWLVVVGAFWAFGATVWLLVGRRDVQLRRHWNDMTGSWAASADRLRGHPAGQVGGTDYPFGSSRRGRSAAMATTRFIAPDDNPDFLAELDRRIQEWRNGA